MPSTYTHYRFGKDVLERLDAELKETIKEHLSLFLIGLHGPDILFYYKALFSNEVNQQGYKMHGQEAALFFKKWKVMIIDVDNSKEALAYALGFICHFTLDSECHGYIEYVIDHSLLTHTEIETDFERVLLQKDGKDPKTYNAASHIAYSEKEAEVISRFYEGVSVEEIEETLKQMKKYNELLLANNPVKRSLIRLLLRLVGKYNELGGLLITEKGNTSCEASNVELERRYELAIPLTVTLMNNYWNYINGKAELSGRFSRTFGPDQEELCKYAGVEQNV